MSTYRKTLLIGLDAADPLLVEGWIRDGILPNLANLAATGTMGRLATSAAHLAGSPWPSFYTGRSPSFHGIYHDYQWKHEDMGYVKPGLDWLAATPFWRRLEPGVRVVAYDVPMTFGCQESRGHEVTCWASHDRLGPPASHPPELLTEIRARFGEWPIEPEAFGPSPVEELLTLRDNLIETTGRSAALGCWLLEQPWDLAILAFSALHPGGHRLWDRSSIEGPTSRDQGETFDGALRDLYIACDDAVGRLVEAAGEATVLVFSLHGMMVNASRNDLLEEMLTRVLRGPGAVARPGVLRRVGEAIPLAWRRTLTQAIPSRLRNRMMTLWSTSGVDWESTEAFSLRADLHGYVRVNLAGREAQGIVAPDRYADICGRIADGLSSFRDATTGEPIVDEVVRADRDLPAGPRLDRLPDLIVRWAETPAALHTALDSAAFGRIERRTPGRIPNARSGNHRAEGFLIATGPGIPAGSVLPGRPHILDLAPTAVSRVRTACHMEMEGRPLFE